MIGDGATSEGDFHEAVNFAAVLKAPVVFLVQNNGYAISVPLAKQCVAPSLAYKGVGYGVPSVVVDGNDVLAVHGVLTDAVRRAAAGGGPTLVEALTYRIDAHTNADDATRYRTDEEVDRWRAHDPLELAAAHLRKYAVLDEAAAREIAAGAELVAGDLRRRLGADPQVDPMELFDHVYAEPTQQLRRQRLQLAGEIEAEAAAPRGEGESR
jgi:pyruvate dehydrogenase E1 component alpha subunit